MKCLRMKWQRPPLLIKALGRKIPFICRSPLPEGGKRKSSISLNSLCNTFVLLAISFENSKVNIITLICMHLWSSGYDVSLTR